MMRLGVKGSDNAGFVSIIVRNFIVSSEELIRKEV